MVLTKRRKPGGIKKAEEKCPIGRIFLFEMK